MSNMVSDENLVFACSRLISNRLPSSRKLMEIPAFGGNPYSRIDMQMALQTATCTMFDNLLAGSMASKR